MQVHHGLPGGLSGVEAHVVAVGRELAVEQGLHVVDEIEDRLLLGAGCVEPGGDDAAGDDEGVAARDGEGVAQCECEVVGGDPLGGWDAEEGRIGHPEHYTASPLPTDPIPVLDQPPIPDRALDPRRHPRAHLAAHPGDPEHLGRRAGRGVL